jgi:adenylate cyclase
MVSLFISSFLIALLSMAIITYVNVAKDIHQVAYDLMEEAANKAYQQITDDITNAEVQSQFTAHLIHQGVIDIKNPSEMLHYFYSTLQMMSQLLPSLQLIEWAEEDGTFYAAEKKDDGSILAQYILRSAITPVREYLYYDQEGHKVIKQDTSTDLSYDPRERPWYKLALEKKGIQWTQVYQSAWTQKLGATLVNPVYDDTQTLLGVLGFNFRLDYLQHFVEKIKTSEHGVVFIISDAGKVIAYPHFSEFSNKELSPIDSIPNAEVIKSIHLYQQHPAPRFDFSINSAHYLAVYKPLQGHIFKHQWIVGVLAPESDFVSQLRRTNMLLLLIGSIIMLIGIIVVTIIISRIVRPLKKVMAETEKIQQFDLEGDPEIKSHISEIVLLTEAIKSMKNGLRQFKKYVPSTLVKQLIAAGDEVKVGGEKRMLAILFSDIKNFTTISEKLEPTHLLAQLCQYFEMTSHIIQEKRGTIDKYIGDAIMAFWGAPLPENQPAVQAALAALAIVNMLEQQNKRWAAEGKPVFETRIGLHYSEAIVGNVGSTERLNYTAIGDGINVASRLENINKQYGTHIMVSDVFYEMTKQHFSYRKVDEVVLKGKTISMTIYELLGQLPLS